MPSAKKPRKKPSKGISTGYNPKTGKVEYTQSVKAKKPGQANYASTWAERHFKDK